MVKDIVDMVVFLLKLKPNAGRARIYRTGHVTMQRINIMIHE